MTIEFKKDDFDDVVAENQVAAASSVSLYNRFRLKEKALRVSGMQWTSQKLNFIQHYCITMKGSTYAVWLGTPIVTENSNGMDASLTVSSKAISQLQKG